MRNLLAVMQDITDFNMFRPTNMESGLTIEN